MNHRPLFCCRVVDCLNRPSVLFSHHRTGNPWPRRLNRQSSTNRPKSALSGWATSACRWSGRSSAAGFRTLGFDVDQTKVDRLLAGESYIEHISSEWIAECIRQNQFEPTADMERLAEADALLICVPTPLSESRDPDLRYIEATTRFDRRDASARPTRRAGKHDLSRHHARRDAADPRRRRPEGRQGLLPGLQPRARGPGQSGLLGRGHSQGGRRHRARERPAGRDALSRRRWSGSCPSRAARWPRPARSSRTPTARSTSPWSTS